MTNDYISLLMTIMQYGKTVSPRAQEIKELLHVKLIVNARCNIYSWPGVRDLDLLKAYVYKELAWYMTGSRDPNYIQEVAKLWRKIINSDGTLNSNYGYLVFYHRTPHPSMGNVTLTPFEWALNSLLHDKDSRQAIMTYNNGGYNVIGNTDYICTQHQAFFIRDNVLKCFIALRSSDSIWGLPYNMIWWSLVQQQLYLKLKEKYPDLVLGNIEVDIYSSHIYAKHYELVDRMFTVIPNRHFFELKEPIPLENNLDFYLKELPNLTQIKDI